jgi:NADPH-dependent 2,4-dienoyl-CoA reductase/sulfur reductase-like enzyme
VRIGMTLRNGGLAEIEKIRAVTESELRWDDQRWTDEVTAYRNTGRNRTARRRQVAQASAIYICRQGIMQTYDAIIVGGGFLGLSTAYQLARAGMRTLLLEAGDIGSGTSASCAGRAQVCEGHLDPLNIKMILEGLRKHETLERELEANYDWHRVGIFLLIRSEELWNRRMARA